ncbi:MAG: hypothetical protein QM523_04110 [Candidatus Pacebacteria bacterium]|nr:hypothetical protein [Candidatus Paceibacterota bacterium]
MFFLRRQHSHSHSHSHSHKGGESGKGSRAWPKQSWQLAGIMTSVWRRLLMVIVIIAALWILVLLSW